MPEEWLFSRICEEFHCTPRDALRQPFQLTMTIMDMRALVRTMEARDKAKDGDAIEDSPMTELIDTFEMEWGIEQLDRIGLRR